MTGSDAARSPGPPGPPGTAVREEFLAPLRRSLAWLLSLRRDPLGEGALLCPEHRVEHTGKSACVAITAVELRRHTADEAERAQLTAVAVQQGRRLVANLAREGDSPCHTFRPGRHDPFNCSNSVIDGGACSDALAHLVTELGNELSPEDRVAFAAASLLHARTYLRYAVLDKGMPPQRAWGMTGLAGALALEADPALDQALVEGIGMLEGVQSPDGSYPYHPAGWGDWQNEHPGAGDVSSFYQSRVTAFVLYALERAGRDPADAHFRVPLGRGLDFLTALQGPDGIKVGLVEAKPWYWGAPYEVASHPFDVYALARGWRHFGRREHGRAALASFRAWADHVGADGVPASHRPGPGHGRSYQCPLFWAAHACWAARALGDLEELARAEEESPAAPVATDSIDLRVLWLASAGVARIEDGAVVAWVRGARPGCNVHHGSPHGAGLLRVVRKSDGADLLARCRLGGANAAEWSGVAGRPSPRRGWRAGGRELRFSLWLARVHLRAGRTLAGLLTPWRVFRRGVLAFGHPRVSSAFHLAPEVEVRDDGVCLRSALAHRDGTPVPGSRLTRTFRVDGGGLVVDEVLESPGAARDVTYGVPPGARDPVEGATRVAYRLA